VAEKYDVRTRSLDPDQGRPLQNDQIGYASEELNLYRWEGNEPTGNLDPTGLQYWGGQQYKPPVKQPSSLPPLEPITPYPNGVEVISGPGAFPYPKNSIGFCARETCDGDKEQIKSKIGLGSVVFDDITSWKEVARILDAMGPDATFTTVVISGHGHMGGIGVGIGRPGFAAPGLCEQTLDSASAGIISRHLRDSGNLVMAGCACGGTANQPAMLSIAKKIDHDVVANDGANCMAGNCADGNWLKFKPKREEAPSPKKMK
jgi:hypothetical protein